MKAKAACICGLRRAYLQTHRNAGPVVTRGIFSSSTVDASPKEQPHPPSRLACTRSRTRSRQPPRWRSAFALSGDNDDFGQLSTASRSDNTANPSSHSLGRGGEAQIKQCHRRGWPEISSALSVFGEMNFVILASAHFICVRSLRRHHNEQFGFMPLGVSEATLLESCAGVGFTFYLNFPRCASTIILD
jgi:hypothetical protein